MWHLHQSVVKSSVAGFRVRYSLNPKVLILGQVVKSQMDQEAAVMQQSMARQESMSQALEKEEEEEAQTSSPTFQRTVSANRPSEAPTYSLNRLLVAPAAGVCMTAR